MKPGIVGAEEARRHCRQDTSDNQHYPRDLRQLGSALSHPSEYAAAIIPTLENNLRTKPSKYRTISSCLTRIEAKRFSNIAFLELTVGPRFKS